MHFDRNFLRCDRCGSETEVPDRQTGRLARAPQWAEVKRGFRNQRKDLCPRCFDEVFSAGPTDPPDLVGAAR